MTKPGAEKTAKRSRIIVEVVNDSKKISDTLFKLKILLSDLGDSEINSWIESELNGYKDEDGAPDYRELNGTLFGNILQPRGLVRQNMAIPVKTDLMDCTHLKLVDNITAIEQYAEQPDKSKLAVPFDARLANMIADFEPNAFCEITNAWIKVPPSKYTDILNSVKGRILDILLMLEKKYGNLDDYAIDFGEEKERTEVTKTLNTIIYNDNSIHIGDNNKISKSEIGESNGG